MSKFRIGQRVIVTNNSGHNYDIGDIATIIKKSPLSGPTDPAWVLEIITPDHCYNTQHLYEEQFKPYIADRLDLI